MNVNERSVKKQRIPLQWRNVSVEAYRDPSTIPGEVTVYEATRFQIERCPETGAGTAGARY